MFDTKRFNLNNLKIGTLFAEKVQEEPSQPLSTSRDGEYVLRSEIRKGFEDVISSSECSEELASQIGLAIELLPSLDVEPVINGCWNEDSVVRNKRLFFFKREQKVVKGYSCSQCGGWKRLPTRFCPNCGAKCQGEC